MNTVSPVTESEMQAFWQRISSMIVGHSVQARQLEEVRADVDRLNQKIADMRTDHDKVTRELAESWQLVSDLEKERDAAKGQVERLQADLLDNNNRHVDELRDRDDRLSVAHDALAGRDSRIAELERNLQSIQDERTDWQNKAEGALRQVQQAQGATDYWRTEAARVHSELAEIKTKVNSIFGKAEPKLVEPPKEEPKQVEFKPWTKADDEIHF